MKKMVIGFWVTTMIAATLSGCTSKEEKAKPEPAITVIEEAAKEVTDENSKTEEIIDDTIINDESNDNKNMSEEQTTIPFVGKNYDNAFTYDIPEEYLANYEHVYKDVTLTIVNQSGYNINTMYFDMNGHEDLEASCFVVDFDLPIVLLENGDSVTGTVTYASNWEARIGGAPYLTVWTSNDDGFAARYNSNNTFASLPREKVNGIIATLTLQEDFYGHIDTLISYEFY